MGKAEKIKSALPTKRASARQGSALIWALMISIVLLILIGVMVSVAQISFHGQKVSQVKTQAYYTARSVNERIANWLNGQEDNGDLPLDALVATDQQRFIRNLKDGPIEATTTIAGVESGATGHGGVADIKVSINGENEPEGTPANTIITIKVTGRFADDSATVVSTLRAQSEFSDLSKLPESKYTGANAPFDLEKSSYPTSAAAFNALTYGTSVNIADLSTSDNSSKNGSDTTTLNNNIDVSSDKEAIWSQLTASNTNFTDNEVLGTQRYSLNGAGGTKVDTRRFVTPKNGRLVINPLEMGEHSTDNGHTNMNSPDATYTNTKISSLAIDTSNVAADENGKENVKFRLANITTMEQRYNAILMLDFTDNAGNTDRTRNEYVWHPCNYDSLDIYMRDDASLNTNILFGPFGHKYDTFMDYWGYGNMVDNWHGTSLGALKAEWPYITDTSHFDDYGLPIFAIDFGNTHIWALDGDRTSRYLRILQGVNLIRGSVYSTRPTIIGGGLIKKDADGKTTDNVNSGVNRFNDGNNTSYVIYTNATSRFSQVIEDTDIILTALSTGTVESTIRRPDTWRDRTYSPTTIPAHDKTYEPTMLITGGSIYVGERQKLNIQGSTLDNMMISPSDITVASGGALNLAASNFANVNTDIFVSGSMTMQPGAKAKGNIIVNEGGAVTIGGDNTNKVAAEYEGDIYVTSGSVLTIGKYAKTTGHIYVSAGGKLNIQAGSAITGDVFCAGNLNIEGDFTLKYATTLDPGEGVPDGDNPATKSINESVTDKSGNYIYHGIFLYDSSGTGAGTLTINGSETSTNPPNIGGDSGRVHSFRDASAITDLGVDGSGVFFCFKNRHDEEGKGTHLCQHWESEVKTWVKQNDSKSIAG